MNNKSLGFVKFGQKAFYHGNTYDVDRPSSDFSKIAEAFGAKGYTITTLNDLDSNIEKIITQEGVKVIDIHTDPEELLPKGFF